MKINSSWDSNSISTLFSSLNGGNKKSSAINMGVDISTLSLIKSGSYHKLLKSYYADPENSNITSSSTSTSEDSAKTIAQVESSASELIESAQKLYKDKDKLFGKSPEDIKMDDIYKAVNSFVDNYNSLVKSAGKSNTTSIANAAASMVNNTKANSSLLSKVGIKMDSANYTLSIDEDTFKKANLSDIKSLFNGNGSFAYSVGVKASMIKSSADIEKSKSNTYNNAGNYTYNYNTGELYNSKF